MLWVMFMSNLEEVARKAVELWGENKLIFVRIIRDFCSYVEMMENVK